MELGVVLAYDNNSTHGQITAADGRVQEFEYTSGQNMMLRRDMVVPRLTGEHEQPKGFRLKQPRVGDAVVFVTDSATSKLIWSYAEHFVYLLEHRHGSEFRNYHEARSDGANAGHGGPQRDAA